jgi:hypothetical protein
MAPDDALRDRTLGTEEVDALSATNRAADGPCPSSQRLRADRERAPERVEEDLTKTRLVPRLLTLGAALVFVAACNQGTAAPSPIAGVEWTPDATLLAAAKSEGTLNTIALPRDWCGYGALLDTFKAKTGLTINEITPNAGSAQEIDAIKNNPNGGPAAPDVIDVGYSFGPASKEEGILQAYKVSTWDTIPADQKDADGFWWGDYYGVLSFEINKDVIKGDSPKDWADLLKPEFAHSVALAGDPLNSNQAIQTVQAASLANGGQLRPDRRQAGHPRLRRDPDRHHLVVPRAR